jgi:hypothetical protein
MRYLACSVFLFLAVGAMHAQHGKASTANFPMGYSGDTWTGQLRSVDDATNKITLVYKGPRSTESFIGILPRGHEVQLPDGTAAEFKPSMIKVGARMRVYYILKYQTVRGARQRINEILKFDFLTAQGN